MYQVSPQLAHIVKPMVHHEVQQAREHDNRRVTQISSSAGFGILGQGVSMNIVGIAQHDPPYFAVAGPQQVIPPQVTPNLFSLSQVTLPMSTPKGSTWRMLPPTWIFFNPDRCKWLEGHLRP